MTMTMTAGVVAAKTMTTATTTTTTETARSESVTMAVMVDGDAPEGGRRRLPRRRPLSARTRILGLFLALVMMALAASSFITWRLLINVTDTRIDRTIIAELKEIETLLRPNVDPQTGEAFEDVQDVIRFAIQYNIAKPNQVFIGYVDGEFTTRSFEVQAPIRLQEVEEFNEQVTGIAGSDVGTLATEAGEVRWAAVRVTVEGQPEQGVIAVAYFRDQERQDADDAARILLLVGGVTLLLAGVAAWVIAGQVLRPLREITDTAQSITDTDLSRRIPVRGNDELATLSRTFNHMLYRLAHSFATQRRFVDDAGHELRTPITIIRGHLEVLDPDDPQDRADTLALVNDELDRMNRMVDDLLLLAKIEQPEFVRAEPTDLGSLARDIFEKACALADRRWMLETVADVTVDLDAQRITQAVIQLAQNATQHTEPGDRIGIGSRATADELRIWVSDTGSGVAEADQERIFGRFARASQSARRSEGAGLGLSIVSAIARAHQGRVSLQSVPGHGATFTLVLPRLSPYVEEDLREPQPEPERERELL
ncbi:HAMP domain-containing sensor histidine kinase [soil metagenome]